MSALAQLTSAGVKIEALPDGRLRASGNLTDTTRALIRAHKPEILAELAANDPGIDSPIDSDVARRRAKALALLAADPGRQIAVIAEAPKPGEAVGHVCTAIRGVAVGEIEIPAERYNAFELWALMQQHEGKLQ